MKSEINGLTIGDRTPEGTVYAGVSPDTGKPIYVTQTDAPLTMTFNAAKEYAAKLDAHGHQDWRVPTKDELNVLGWNRAAIGGFNETGSDSAGRYCSSSQDVFYVAWQQRFSDGQRRHNSQIDRSSLRCIR
jgi:hypothetical protein